MQVHIIIYLTSNNGVPNHEVLEAHAFRGQADLRREELMLELVASRGGTPVEHSRRLHVMSKPLRGHERLPAFLDAKAAEHALQAQRAKRDLEELRDRVQAALNNEPWEAS